MTDDSKYDIYQQAHALMELDKYDKAATLLEPLIGDVNIDAHAFILLSNCYLNLEKIKEERQLLSIAIERFPNHPSIHYDISNYYSLIEKPQKALDSMMEALKLDPENAHYMCKVAAIYLEMRKFAKAKEYIHKAESIEPNEFEIVTTKAFISYEEGNYENSEYNINRALEMQPNNSVLLSLKSNIISLDSKKMKEAEELAINSLQTDPNDEFAKSSLLEILKNRNWLLRFFVGRSFSRYKMEWSIGRIILMIFLWKGVFLWWAIALLYLLVTWYGGVLFNTLSRLSFKYKLLLSRKDILQSNVFILLNVLLVVLISWAKAGEPQEYKMAATYIFGAYILLTSISYFEIHNKWNKVFFFVYMGLTIFAILSGLGGPFYIAIMSLFFLLAYGFLFTLRITFT